MLSESTTTTLLLLSERENATIISMAPYIKQDDRHEFALEDIQPETAGELNFVVSTIISNYIKKKGLKYQNINDVMGVLDSAAKEFYRRVAAPYEDTKTKENGDIGYPKV